MELFRGARKLRLVLNFRHHPRPPPPIQPAILQSKTFNSRCWASLPGWRAPQVCVRTRDPGNARPSMEGKLLSTPPRLPGRTASPRRRGRQHFHKGKRREPQGRDDAEAGPAGSRRSPRRQQLPGGRFPGAGSGSGRGGAQEAGVGAQGTVGGGARPDGGGGPRPRGLAPVPPPPHPARLPPGLT